LSLDSINFKRQDRLWKQNVGTKVELNKAKIKYDATQNRYNALKKKYSQTDQNLENNYKKALNLVANERTSLDDYIIRAEIDGKVYDIFKEVGEVINPQEKFAEIGDSHNYKIDIDIDEVEITKINLGDTVVISLEAYPEKVFMAKITKIYPKKNENTQTFKIESSFIKNPPKL
jgi:HlyD family secretion protein